MLKLLIFYTVKLKPWIFYIIIAWQIGPLAPEEQKTLILQFESKIECESVSVQVQDQVAAARSIFFIKKLQCFACIELYDDKMCKTVLPKKKA